MRYYYTEGCLNPCCNGRGAKTDEECDMCDGSNWVLILVVMEEGQRHNGVYHSDDMIATS